MPIQLHVPDKVSIRRDWELGAFQCDATSTGGNNSMAVDGNYKCFEYFFTKEHILACWVDGWNTFSRI